MTTVGTIESLWRYPVKSMRGEALPEAFLGFPGIYGDRAYAFQSTAAPAGFPWLTGRENAEMLRFSPKYRHPQHATAPRNLAEADALSPGITPVYADFADLALDVETPAGESLAIDDPLLIERLREGTGTKHQLTLLRSHRALTDCRPVSIFSLQTARQLSAELGDEIDKRRFRANLYIDLISGNGFGEDAFVGCHLQIGHRAVVAVVSRDSRCKMITLHPDTAQANPALMKAVARAHEGMAGVYGAVLVEGIIRPGDPVALL